MLRVLGRRGFEAGISLFAVLGFCYVPLGTHTGLEHAKAVLQTPAAKRAGSELLDAFWRLRGKLASDAIEFAKDNPPTAAPPTLPAPKPRPLHSASAHAH